MGGRESDKIRDREEERETETERERDRQKKERKRKRKEQSHDGRITEVPGEGPTNIFWAASARPKIQKGAERMF